MFSSAEHCRFTVTWWVGSLSTSTPPGTQRQAVRDQLIGTGHDVDVRVHREHVRHNLVLPVPVSGDRL
jgi:hypothetical protein